MQVLIVDDDQERQSALMIAFMEAGFQTTATASQEVAESFMRHSLTDLLVMAERVGGRLTHSLALLAEYRAPLVATLLMTSRTDDDVDELFLLLPSLHGLLPPDLPAAALVKLALASVAGASPAKALVDPEDLFYDARLPGPPMLLDPTMRVPATAPVFVSHRIANDPAPMARSA